MSNMFNSGTLLNLLIWVGCSANAQSINRQVTASDGKELTNNTAKIAFTIGEPLTSSLNSGTAEASQVLKL